MSKFYFLLFFLFAKFSLAQVANDTTSLMKKTKEKAVSQSHNIKENSIGKLKQYLQKKNKKIKNSNNSLNTAASSDTVKSNQLKNKLPKVRIKEQISAVKNDLDTNSTNTLLIKDSTKKSLVKDKVSDKTQQAPVKEINEKFDVAKNTLQLSKDSTSIADTTKITSIVSQSKIAQPFTDRFESLPLSKDSSLKSNAVIAIKNSLQTPHFDLKEKADLKGKTKGVKGKLISQRESLLKTHTFKADSIKPKAIAFAKKQVKEFKPKGSVAIGYEYGVLPSVMGNSFPTGGYRAEGQVGFMFLNLPLQATFHYSNIKNVVGFNNYFRISYDANQYKEQLAQKLNVKDQLTQKMLSNLQLQQQQLLQQMEYSNMLNQSFNYQNALNGNFNTNGLEPNLNGLTTNLGSNYNLNALTDTSGLMAKVNQYGTINQYSNLNDSAALSYLNNKKGNNEYMHKKDSIVNVIAVNKAKYDSINQMITEAQQQMDQIKNLQSNSKLTNPYLTKVQQFMSHIKKLEIGLCNPNYSTLLVNNIPLQGINVEYEKNDNFLAVTYGTTLSNLLFNTNTLQGSLQGVRNLYNYFDFGNLSAGRKILSVKGGVGTKEKSHLYVGFLLGKGKTDYALPIADPTKVSTESNLVMEVDGKYVFTEQVSLDVIVGKSSVKEEDLTMEQIKKSVNELFSNYRSNAVLTKLNFAIKKTKTKITLSTRWIDPYFKSFGLGFLRSDNLRYEVKGEQPITKKIKYTIAYRREEDNLLKLLAYKNTLHSINNSLSIKLKKGFNIRLNYAPLFREFKTADIIVKDKNHIATVIVSYIPKMKKVAAQFNVLYSRYIITGDSSNINFENFTYTYQFQFKSGFKTGLSSSWFKDNLKDSLNNDTYLSVVDVGYATDKGNSFSVGGKIAYKKTGKPQYGFLAKATIKLYKGLFFEAEAEKIIIGDYYNAEMIEQIKKFPFYINTRLVFNF